MLREKKVPMTDLTIENWKVVIILFVSIFQNDFCLNGISSSPNFFAEKHKIKENERKFL